MGISESVATGRLAGRRILITGGASGIGLATVKLFASEGAKAAILDRSEEAAQVAAKVGGFAQIVDLTDQLAIAPAVDAVVDGLGGLDGLVNCAGLSNHSRTEQGDIAGWTTTLAVNLTAPFLVTVAALKHLRTAERATIVNVASSLALRPGPVQGSYATSKAGLHAWTKVLAQEVGPNIRVNATAPGPTDTPLLRASSARRGLNDLNSLGDGRALERTGEALEQAYAILFLTSDESSYISGITVPVDGGRAYY